MCLSAWQTSFRSENLEICRGCESRATRKLLTGPGCTGVKNASPERVTPWQYSKERSNERP